MFVLISLALGVLSAWFTAELHLVFQKTTEFVLISLTFWFVIPLGGFVVGAVGASGVSLTNFFRKKDAPGTGALIGSATGLLSWYLVYQVAADAGGYESISDYMYDLMTHSDIAFALEIGHHHAHADLPPVPFLAGLSMIVQPFGAIVGGLFAGVMGAIKSDNQAARSRAPGNVV